jgi:DNA-binding CsgD family transcriptional regulator
VSEEEIVGRFSGAFAVSTFRAGMRSMMAVPLISRDEVIGTLHFRAKKPNAYTEGDLRLAERIGAQIAGAVANAQLFEELKKTKDRLQDSEKELRRTLDNLEITITQRTVELEETNTALRVLLKKGDKDQRKLEETLQSNVNQLVTPFLSKLRVSQSTEERQTYVNILKTNLNNITSPFINHLSVAFKNLTPKEIQIAELIKQGKRSKEIAELFGVSVGTVITHRNNIRKKLKLKSRDANLRSHLLSLA